MHVPSAKSVLWSDIPNDRVMRFDECDGSVSVFEVPCGYHNGHTLDAEGRVVACEHGGGASRGWIMTACGAISSRIGRASASTSPNDVVVKRDGTVWFSDPTYGIDFHYEGHRAPSEIGASNVYRLDPATGELTVVITDMLKPNGSASRPMNRSSMSRRRARPTIPPASR